MPNDTRTCSIDDCSKPVKTRGLCGMHYQRLLRQGHTDVTRIAGAVEDFYDAGDRSSCWLWRGSFNGYGYGRYGRQMAHRVVYERHRGRIPDGLVLDHLCRNTACVNPAHLEPVQQGTNIARGLLGYALRTTCANGLHDITSPESWYVNSAGHRTCLECKRANDRRAEARRAPRARR